MKNHKQTDRIIKNKMEQYSMETPMHLFAGIADALDADVTPAFASQKNHWRKGFWMLALLALVVGGSGVWLLTSDDNSSSKTGTEMSISLNSENAKTDLGKIEKVESTNNSSITEETVKGVANHNQIENDEFETSISNLKNPIGSSLERNKVEETILGTTSSVNIANSSSTRKSSNTHFDTSTSKDILIQKGGGRSEKINSSNSENKTISTDLSVGIKPIAEASIANIITAKKTTEEVFNLPNLNQLANSSIFHSTPYRIAVEPSCGLKPDGSKIKFTTSVDAFFSPDYANQILEYKSEDFREHAQQRTDTEKPYYSFNTGVRVNFLTEFGWAIRTGLVYTQINEILETQYTEIVTTLDANGNVIGTTEGTRDVNIRNNYKMFDIPIIFGYEVPMKKFDLNVNGGVYMNLISKQSGAFFSPIEDRVVYFTEGHPDDYDIFKNNIGLSVFMGLGFNFDLTSAFNANKKTQLIVEPHARFYPKSFALDNYILNQKYFSTGLMIGLRRDL